ncbi:alpha/beta hydrolase [Pedobacter westerhofensis]|uniref:alpha/beta hydrolase n=1 Tax=Pedobacter westerhofensis TaxID=425512 RepID=UPI001C8F8D62|nr:alpha/beta hydrolase [Pedobacter westerhofensis]
MKDLVYKKIDTTELHLKVFYPNTYTAGKSYPSIVFFFGGGWITGSLSQFQEHAKYLASRGMIGITADYRYQKRDHTTPFEAIADGRSAIRYLRQHARELGIDPHKLAAGGGSAGGQIAAAADLTSDHNQNEDLAISSRPDALVLFNPVFNNGPGNYGYDRIGGRYKEVSPFHNIKPGAAPAIVFFGTKDQLVAVDTARAYQEVMKKNGNRCDLFFYEGQVHGFFNYRPAGDSYYYLLTLSKATSFLKSLGYIN